MQSTLKDEASVDSESEVCGILHDIFMNPWSWQRARGLASCENIED